MRYVGPRHIVIDDQPTPVPFWEPERLFDGETVVLIGGGPSLENLDLELLRSRRFVAINSGCRKVLPVASADDVLYFTDNSWNENRPELVDTWPGPVITSNRNAKMRLGDRVKRIDITAIVERLECFPDWVYASSGHGAAALSVVMGAAKLVLIGFEAKLVDGRSHGHSDYYQHDVSAFEQRYLPAWSGLSKVFERFGVEVINSTPESAIKSFPFLTLGEALRC